MSLSSRKGFLEATFVVMALNILSKVFGLAREQIFAMFFGATGELDAKVAAERITAVVTILSGPVSTTFLPLFAGYAAKGDDESARRLGSSIITVSSLLVLVLGALLFIPAPQIVKMMSPGFSQETLRTATLLTRALLPVMLLPLLSAFGKSILNTYGNFAIPAFAPSLQNMILIAFAALFGPVMGVKSLAIGFPLAYFAATAIHLPAWKKTQAWPALSLTLGDDAKRVLRMAGPIVLGSVFAQLYGLVNLNLASRLSEGSVAALSLADKLRQFPLGFFAVAITTVIFPALSGMWSKGDKEGFMSTTVNGLRFVEFVCVPAALGLIILGQPIVRLVYQRGAFTAEHTAITASALLAYAPAIVGMAALSVVTIAFYSTQETRIPVALAVGTAGLNVALDFLLVGPLGFRGLAFANSIAQTVGALAGIWLLHRALGGMPLGSLTSSLVKILTASAAMAVAAGNFSRYLGFTEGTGSTVGDLFRGGLAIILAAAVYLLVAVILRTDETRILFSALRSRTKWLGGEGSDRTNTGS